MAKKKLILSALCTICTVQSASSFSLGQGKAKTEHNSRQVPKSNTSANINTSNNHPLALTLSHSVGAIPLIITSIASAADDYEVAELPPVYVPILFAIAIIGGVGVLTASLGDVMDEGMCRVSV
jgi:hypothetical protein